MSIQRENRCDVYLLTVPSAAKETDTKQTVRLSNNMSVVFGMATILYVGEVGEKLTAKQQKTFVTFS